MEQSAFKKCLAGTAVLILGTAVCVYLVLDPVETDIMPSVSSEPRDRKLTRKGQGIGSHAENIDDQRARIPKSARSEGDLVHLMPDQVLATVNNRPIKPGDLLPVQGDATGEELPRDVYAFRLRRAVDMEIILQAAAAGNVELTEAQEARVNAISEGNEAEMDHYRQYGVSWRSTGRAHLEFEKRLLIAQLLEQNLVAMKSEVGPSVEPDVQTRYEQARVELLAQLYKQADVAILAPVGNVEKGGTK